MVLRSKLASDAAIYTLSNFCVAGIPFLLLPILTRYLSPESYGTVAMFSVVVAFFSVGVGLNVNGAIMVRYFDRDNFHIPQYVTTCVLLLIGTTFLLSIGAVLFESILAQVTTLPLNLILLAICVAGLQFLVQILLTLWQSSKQPIKYGLIRLGQACIDGVISVFLVVIVALSWEGRIRGMILASLVAGFLAVYLLFKEGWLAKSGNLIYAKDALRYGVPLIPHAIGGLLLGMVDRIMVTNYLDISSTGLYVVAAQIGMILGIAADAFNRAFAPWLMESLQHKDAGRDIKIVRFTYIYIIVILSVALFGGIVAPHMLGVLVGPQYQEAAPVARYILIGNAFIGMYYMVTNYIFFARRTELLSILTISVGTISVGLSWYLINLNGLVGAAQAFMTGQILMFLGAWCLAQYCHRMPWASGVLFGRGPAC